MEKVKTVTGTGSGTSSSLEGVRAFFPILEKKIHGHALVYLDSAASAQKPRQVIEAESFLYREAYANVHRSPHELGSQATGFYEQARDKIASFIGASASREIIFTRGATEGLNLLARAIGDCPSWPFRLQAGDVVLLTGMEHHSNIVPWFQLRDRLGVEVRFVPVTPEGTLAPLTEDLLAGVRVASLTHVSNVLGTVNPVQELVRRLKERDIVVILDGSQAAPHFRLDVSATGADFYAFTGHKLYGPTGIGVLWGREKWLELLPPFLGGGEMIRNVSVTGFTVGELPHKFEAGTPPIAQAHGLAAAVDFLNELGFETIEAHERACLHALRTELARLPAVTLLGGGATGSPQAPLQSFILEGAHPHDVATLLDQQGVAIRAGHHCAEPLTQYLNAPSGTNRVSLGLYNTEAEIDILCQSLRNVCRLLKLAS